MKMQVYCSDCGYESPRLHCVQCLSDNVIPTVAVAIDAEPAPRVAGSLASGTINHPDKDVQQVAAALADACHAGSLSEAYYRVANDALRQLAFRLAPPRVAEAVAGRVEPHDDALSDGDLLHMAEVALSFRRERDAAITERDHARETLRLLVKAVDGSANRCDRVRRIIEDRCPALARRNITPDM